MGMTQRRSSVEECQACGVRGDAGAARRGLDDAPGAAKIGPDRHVHRAIKANHRNFMTHLRGPERANRLCGRRESKRRAGTALDARYISATEEEEMR